MPNCPANNFASLHSTIGCPLKISLGCKLKKYWFTEKNQPQLYGNAHRKAKQINTGENYNLHACYTTPEISGQHKIALLLVRQRI